MTNLKGISEYGVAKAAYERARKIISSENPNRKELSDVLGVLEANKEGVEVLKQEEGDNYSSIYEIVKAIGTEERLKTKCKRSYGLLKSINAAFRREDGLYRPNFDMPSKDIKPDDTLTIGSEDIRTNIHAGMAILYAVLGNKEEAGSILSKFEERINNRARLYRWSDRGDCMLTSDNALIAVAYASIGNRKRAEEIFDAIESKCLKLHDSFYYSDVSRVTDAHEIRADTNAAMGIAHRVVGNDARANAIIPSIEELFRVENSRLYHNSIKYPVKFNLSEIKNAVDRRFIDTSTNALMAFAHALSGYYEKAGLILEEIEEKRYAQIPLFSSKLRGDIFFEINTKRAYPFDNALMAIAYALIDGAKLCGLPKRGKDE